MQRGKRRCIYCSFSLESPPCSSIVSAPLSLSPSLSLQVLAFLWSWTALKALLFSWRREKRYINIYIKYKTPVQRCWAIVGKGLSQCSYIYYIGYCFHLCCVERTFWEFLAMLLDTAMVDVIRVYVAMVTIGCVCCSRILTWNSSSNKSLYSVYCS